MPMVPALAAGGHDSHQPRSLQKASSALQKKPGGTTVLSSFWSMSSSLLEARRFEVNASSICVGTEPLCPTA